MASERPQDKYDNPTNVRAMRDATRLAAKGKAKCTKCHKMGELREMLTVAFANNVMLTLHPGCLEHVAIFRDGPDLKAEISSRKESSRPSSLYLPVVDAAPRDVPLALPDMRRVNYMAEGSE